nr:hypothetical protein [Tanacetum cinerariifolium]
MGKRGVARDDLNGRQGGDQGACKVFGFLVGNFIEVLEGVEQEEAVKTLKDNVFNTPILSLPDGAEDFVVYCDASNQGAVLFAFKTWRHYLYGTKSVIYTDHKSLQHTFDQKELNMRQRRWIELFRNYECKIRYHPCKENSKAFKEENLTAEMLHGLDQLMKRKEDKDYKIETLARIYIDEIVAGHGVPVSIISDRDGIFTLRFWQTFHKALGMGFGYEYDLSSSDGYTKSPVLWVKIRESGLIGLELVQETTDKVVLIKENLKATRDRQKSYANNRRKLLEFEVEDQVLLKVSP